MFNLKFPTSEDDWNYNGLLSYSTEWHMATIGLAIGILLGSSKRFRREFRKEPHYLFGFSLIGWIFSFLLKKYFRDKKGE